MKTCPYCYAQLEDDASFCVACGKDLTQPTPSPAPAPQPVPAPAKASSGAWPVISRIIAFVVGIVLIAIGYDQVDSAFCGIYSTSFGADFYTYTYKGIVEAAEQLTAIREALGWVIVAIGASTCVNALKK